MIVRVNVVLNRPIVVDSDLTVLFTVTVNDSSPIQDYVEGVHPDDQTQPTFKT